MSILLVVRSVSGAAAPGTAQFTATTFVVGESGGTLSANVDGSGPVSGAALQATCMAESGTATLGEDFGAPATFLSWGVGQADTRNCVFPIYPDSEVEGTETFTIRLETAAGEVLTTATVTITDDDTGAGVLTITCCSNPPENHASAMVMVTRSGSTSGEVGVSWATEAASSPDPYDIPAVPGKDFVPSSGELVWANGQGGVQMAMVPLLDDGIWEEDQVFGVRISAPTGGAELGVPSAMAVIIGESLPKEFPLVSNIQPSSGPSSGGTDIQIFGNKFNGVSSVTLGGQGCLNVNFVANLGRLTCTTPPHAPGTVEVVVTTPKGTNRTYMSGNEFTYVDSGPGPTATSTTPQASATAGGGSSPPSASATETTPTSTPTPSATVASQTATPSVPTVQLKYRIVAGLVVFDGWY